MLCSLARTASSSTSLVHLALYLALYGEEELAVVRKREALSRTASSSTSHVHLARRADALTVSENGEEEAVHKRERGGGDGGGT